MTSQDRPKKFSDLVKLCKQVEFGHTWQCLPMTFLANLVFFHDCENKNGLGGSNELNLSAFERGDPGASLEKRMKSFGDIVADFW